MDGGGNCSICKSVGTSKLTCPLNPDAKNINIEKHYLAKTDKKSKSKLKKTKKISKKLKNEEVKPYIKKSIKLNKSIKFVQDNPKIKKSKSFIRYEKYK